MPHGEPTASGQSDPSREPRPVAAATSMSDEAVITTLLEFFARKQFPVDVGKLAALFESNETLVRSACQIILDSNCYRDEVAVVHKAIKEVP